MLPRTTTPPPPPTVVLDFAKLKFLNCGVGQLCLHLGRSLLSECAHQLQYQFLLPENRKPLFPGHEQQCIALRNWHRQRVRAWSQYLGIRGLGNIQCDLWHWTHQDSEYWPPNARVPVVLNILDLNFMYEGKSPAKTRRRLHQLQQRVDRATCIVAISEFTASEIHQHLNVGEKPIHVVHMGVASDEPQQSVRPGFLPPGEFLYTIGDISPKKNVRVLLGLAKQLPEYRIIVAGRKTSEYARAMQREIEERGLREQVFMPGQVDDQVRQWLYQNCSAFLFPSLAEGFGLPVIEAMMLGRPVFMSDRTSLPEIGGPLGFYWDSFESHAMARVFRDGMRVVHNDRAYRDKLRAYARQFSWQRAAQKYLGVYRSVLPAHIAQTIHAKSVA